MAEWSVTSSKTGKPSGILNRASGSTGQEVTGKGLVPRSQLGVKLANAAYCLAQQFALMEALPHKASAKLL